MAYRIEPSAPIDKEVRRILIEQIGRAEKRLRSAEDRAVAVHEARKGFKRIRALLRLARPAIGAAAFKRENAAFRDIASLLAGARDAHVLLQTIAKLEADHDLDPARHTADLRHALAALPEIEAASAQSAIVRDALKRLKTARSRIAHLHVDAPDFSAIAKGLERCYREARAARKTAIESGRDQDFHEWRKRVQQHWRHMNLLGRAWPDYFAARSRAAKRLSAALGDDHDLAMLVVFIERQPAEALKAGERRELVRLARKSQAELRAAAAEDGARLFEDGAGGLARRLAAYWDACRSAPSARGETAAADAREEGERTSNSATDAETDEAGGSR